MSVLAAAPATLSSAPLWFLTRSTGLVAFAGLTITTALGVASTQRALASRAWPRFATQALHRNVSLLAVVMLLVHAVTTILDSYVKVSWLSLVVPFTAQYRTGWVALGTVALDLLLVVAASSLLRLRLPRRLWRGLHWTAYAAWPLALVHFLKTGTDVGNGGRLFAAGALLVVTGAAAVRLATSNAPRLLRSVAGGAR